MREIKFRAWDGKKMRRWGFVDDAFWGPPSSPEGNPMTMIHMQFTGLKDKNGKEICEGDVVKIASLSYGVFSAPIEYLAGRCSFGAVTWTNKVRQITMPERKWDRPHSPCGCDGAMWEAQSILNTGDTFADKNKEVEVIGNIYEHPELVKSDG